MSGAPSKRKIAAAQAEVDKTKKETDAQAEALRRVRERRGARGPLGFTADWVSPTLGGKS
jgi:hypothetical protein